MTAPPFQLLYAPEALAVLNDLKTAQYKVKAKKVAKALRLLETVGPSYPGLNSHLYQSHAGPFGEPLWESYVENETPSAWRLWWSYGPEPDQLTVLTTSSPARADDLHPWEPRRNRPCQTG